MGTGEQVNTAQQHAVKCSAEYIAFWECRGAGPPVDMYLQPTTEEQITEASRLTKTIITLLQDPAFSEIWKHLASQATVLIRKRLISGENHMEVIKAFEIATEGRTTEEFIASLPKEQ